MVMPLRRALQYVTVLGLLMLFNVPPVSPGDSQEGWISKAEMSMPRSYFGIGVVDGVIYVIGGMTGEEGKELSLAEAYYPSKDMWAIRNPMPTARSSVGSATVRDKVYVLGGMAGTEILSTVEAYDPSSDSWSRRAPMPTSRFGLAAVSIGDRIYAIGVQTLRGNWLPLKSTMLATTSGFQRPLCQPHVTGWRRL